MIALCKDLLFPRLNIYGGLTAMPHRLTAAASLLSSHLFLELLLLSIALLRLAFFAHRSSSFPLLFGGMH